MLGFDELEDLGKEIGLKKLEEFIKKLREGWGGDNDIYIEVKCLDCEGVKGDWGCERCEGEGYELVKNSRFGDLKESCEKFYLKMRNEYLDNVKEEVEGYLNMK